MIYLLRHGETEFNAAGRYQGRVDSPLTPLGRAQAARAGATLAAALAGRPVPPLWVSPLGRAVATAEIVRAALDAPPPIRLDPRLQEVGMGRWDGLTAEEIDAGWPGARKRHPKREWMFHGPEGEDLTALHTRLTAVLAEAAALPDVILIGHGLTGRLLRGIHAGLSTAEVVRLDAVQGEVELLLPGGGLARLTAP